MIMEQQNSGPVGIQCGCQKVCNAEAEDVPTDS